MKFRFHQGSLKDSLTTEVEVNSKAELISIIGNWAIDNFLVYGPTYGLTVNYYAYDPRVDRNLYLVKIMSQVAGFLYNNNNDIHLPSWVYQLLNSKNTENTSQPGAPMTDNVKEINPSYLANCKSLVECYSISQERFDEIRMEMLKLLPMYILYKDDDGLDLNVNKIINNLSLQECRLFIHCYISKAIGKSFQDITGMFTNPFE